MVLHFLIGENFGRITETSPLNEISLNSASIATQIFDMYTRNLCWISKVSIRASEIAGGGLIYRIFVTICVTYILREFSTKPSNFQYIYKITIGGTMLQSIEPPFLDRNLLDLW